MQSLLIEEPYPPELRSSWQLRIEASVQLLNGSRIKCRTVTGGVGGGQPRDQNLTKV